MPESVLGYGILAALALLFALALWRTVRKRGTGCCSDTTAHENMIDQGVSEQNKFGSCCH